MKIYNSLSRQEVSFQPLEAGHVRMYVCGMTVYDFCHLGHARVLVVFDMVQRWLKTLGYRVTYVRNITDIDDKIIRRALERGEGLRDLTNRMIASMHEDEAQLLVQAPTHEPRATEYVPQMLGLIKHLETKGLAYQSRSGDVLYSVRKFADYGKLSGKSINELRAGERVAVEDDKNDPLDFVLWKHAKTDEPTEAKWEGDYGLGRPGWHIECSAMSQALLGESFDIHGGGADLQFPHHENEIAQSEGACGKPLAQVWMHGGFLNVDNTKMSKSLGNFFTIREVLKRYDGETIRFFILRSHYRSPLNYSDWHLDDARAGLKRLYTCLQQVPAQADFVLDWSSPYAARFKAAMDADFATPEALAVLFELTAEVNRTASPLLAAELKALGAVLGLLQAQPETFLQAGSDALDSELDVEAIEAQIALRQAAKSAKDFAQADTIRKTLLEQGVVLKDTAAGTVWERV